MTASAQVGDGHDGAVCVRVGTIASAEDARRAIEAGAHFCVSPRIVPGGRRVLDAAGVRYLASLVAVAPGARIMPAGGIPLDEVHDWLAAGALAVGVGSDLTAPGDIAARVRMALAG